MKNRFRYSVLALLLIISIFSCKKDSPLTPVKLSSVLSINVDKQPIIKDTLTFSTNAKGIKSYQWNFGDGTNSTLAMPKHRYNTINTYTISLTVIDSLGQSQQASIQLNFTNGIKFIQGNYLFSHVHILNLPQGAISKSIPTDTTATVSIVNDSTINLFGYNLVYSDLSFILNENGISYLANLSQDQTTFYFSIANVNDYGIGYQDQYTGTKIK